MSGDKYAVEVTYRITIPLRGGDEVLTVSPNEDPYLTVPIDLLERLAELHDVVITVEKFIEHQAVEHECDCGTGGLLIGGGHEHWCAALHPTDGAS